MHILLSKEIENKYMEVTGAAYRKAEKGFSWRKHPFRVSFFF